MISQNQIQGLPEAINELDRLSNIEISSVSQTEIDDIFDKKEPSIEEE